MMTLSSRGESLIKSFESLALVSYQDSVGVWTIGWGHTGEDVHLGMSCTPETAQMWFEHDVQTAITAVNRLVTATLNQNQFDALVSWTYNLGAGSLKESSMLNIINRGMGNRANVITAANQMLRWNKAGGKVLAGLTRRRQSEADLFLMEAGMTQ